MAGNAPIAALCIIRSNAGPKNFIAIDDVDKAKSLLKFMDALDDNDDVPDVTANFDIPDNIMENIE